MEQLARTIVTGLVATATMDLWGALRGPLLGLPPLDYRLLGRWVGGMARGRFRHRAIAASPALRGERAIGWLAHYGIGLAFAAVLVGIAGAAWLRRPTLAPALAFGLVTVAAPLLLMHPGMGNGLAASRTPRPGAARLQSLVSHAVFGLGLYAGGWVAHLLFTLVH